MLRKIIDRPITVTMIILVAVVIGAVCMRLLPVSLIPEVDAPFITVQVDAPNLSSREIDESVVGPLRQQLVQVSGLSDIVAQVRDGSGMIRLVFNYGTNISYSFIEVNEKIDRSMGSLPDIERPKVLKSTAADIPAFYVDMTLAPGSLSDFSELSRFARDVLAKRIEQLPEVAMADVSGLVREQISVLPDMDLLAQAGMTLAQFEQVLRSLEVRLGNVSIHDGEYSYSVKFRSGAASAQDLRSIWFSHNGRLLQVGDVASVQQCPAKSTGCVRSDGSRALTIAVIKQSDARMADLKAGMNSLMENFRNDYPDVSFTITRDQTALLEYSIRNLMRNILMGIIFACVVIFLFMKDFRSPTLVALTIPLALIISMTAFHVLGLSINIISLSGLLLGVGMMVDNTIILVDNITDRWNRLESLRDAVLDGTREVASPMLSSVLTTCAVFIPLVFARGMAGAMFYEEAMAIAVVLLTSYAVTMTVIPVYYWCWYRKMPQFRPNPLLSRISLDSRMVAWDHRVMQWFLRNGWLSWTMLAVSGVGMALCLVLMPRERLPEMTCTETVLKIEWNEHITIEENERRVAALEACANEALHVTSLVGAQQFVLSHSGDQTVSEASVYLQFPDSRSLSNARDALSEILARDYPCAVSSFEASGNIFDMVFSDREGPLTLRLRPVNRPEIDVALLEKTVSAVRDALPHASVQEIPTKTDMVFIADAQMLALYEVSSSELSAVLRNALDENVLFEIVQGTRTLLVVTGTNSGSLAEILENTFIEQTSRKVPVSLLMKQTYERDLKILFSGVEGSYFPLAIDVPASEVPSAVSAVRRAVRDVGDFEASFSGSWFSNRSMAREMLVLLLVALLLLYLILASQFESLLQPLLILSEVVIDIFLSLLVLWALGISLNLMSMIGLVVICGIVINDSILKIDTVNRFRAEGFTVDEAILTAGGRRIKAIVMTSLTTILSVLPFLSRGSMGDDLQYPMSVVIIAGMSVGTLVSLFVLPSLYGSIYKRR